MGYTNIRECVMASYPKSVMDSLKEYSEKYRLNAQEYKDLINRIEKIPLSSLEKLEIYNKGKTNLERGSLVIVQAPTTKGKSTRVYVALTGMPTISGKGGNLPVLDLHSLNILEDPAVDSIQSIPTSDDKKINETNTQGFYVLSNLGIRSMEQKKKEEEAPLEIYDAPKKETKKKAVKKKPTTTKKEKKEDAIEIPEPSQKREKREKILKTVKEVIEEEKRDDIILLDPEAAPRRMREAAQKLEEDKKREREEEEILKLEEAYKKMRFACVTTIHNMGYTKKEAEGICNDLDGVIEEHVRSAIEKRTPNAVEEYVRLLTDKVIPSKVKKPQKLSKTKKEEKFPVKTKWQPLIEKVNVDGFNLEMLKTTLYLSCLSNVVAYGMSIKDATKECESIRGDINEIAEKIHNKSQSAEMGIDSLNDIVHKKIEISKVAKKAQQVVKQVQKSYADSLKSELLTYYGVDPKNVKGARGKVLMDLAAAIRSRRGGEGFEPIHTLPDPSDPEITVYMSRQWCYIVKNPGEEGKEKNWRLAYLDGVKLGYYEKEVGQ